MTLQGLIGAAQTVCQLQQVLLPMPAGNPPQHGQGLESFHQRQGPRHSMNQVKNRLMGASDQHRPGKGYVSRGREIGSHDD
jgi:hypothetical protein